MASNQSNGIGLPGVLGIVFIVLKLVGVIDWSWWWVLSPFLIPIGILLALFVGLLTARIFWNAEERLSRKPKRKWKDIADGLD